MRILMVCLGNICRSPIAEGILAQKAQQRGLPWVVESAGTNGFHDGEPPHPLSQKVSAQHGVDISGQISRRLTQADFKKYDRLYAMADDVLREMQKIGKEDFDPQKAILFLEERYPGKQKNVPDPWYGEEEDFVEVYQLIDETCDAIINNFIAHQKEPK